MELEKRFNKVSIAATIGFSKGIVNIFDGNAYLQNELNNTQTLRLTAGVSLRYYFQ